MTFVDGLGYKVGDVFVYDVNVDGLNNLFNSDFSLDDELTLVEDDGSSCPKFRQGDIEAYEDLVLLKKIEGKPLSYADFVGKSLIVKEFGYGFLESDIGRICKIEAYSDNGYADGKGFKVEGYDNYGRGFVGVKSFFPDGLTYGSAKDALAESGESEEGQRQVTETVTKCPSTAIYEMLLSCFDDGITVEIAIEGVKVKWRGLTFAVDKEVGLEQIVKAVDLLSEQQVEG